MKCKNCLITFFVVLVFVLGLGMVSAIDISVENYYPTPVEAGEYLNVWLKVNNPENAEAQNAVVRFKESFPFSLDPGEGKEFVVNTLSAGGFAIVKMKIRVDAGAAEGDNKLSFQYADQVGGQWKEKSIPVTVVESKTTFDVVLQELNEEGVFIAVSNIGKNSANAVTVRIPEQENFRTQTVSASVVGNLASGDYTLVGFQIISKTETQKNLPDKSSSEEEKAQTRGQQISTDEEKDLQVQIDYTDPLGIRRTIYKDIPLNTASLMSTSNSGLGTTLTTGGNLRNGQSGITSFLSNTWFWVSVVLLAIMIGQAVYKKIKRRKE